MATDELKCEDRTDLGTKATQRLRRDGSIPINLYGHGKKNKNLTVASDIVEAMLRKGVRLFKLTGAAKDTALIREVQWNTFGTKVLHMDLTRVKAGEKVEVSIAIELRGEAPGVKEGGKVTQLAHEVTILCPVTEIPEKFEVSINALGLAEVIHARAIELPADIELITSADAAIASCEARLEIDEDEDAAEVDLASEPEVIGQKEEDEEDSDS